MNEEETLTVPDEAPADEQAPKDKKGGAKSERKPSNRTAYKIDARQIAPSENTRNPLPACLRDTYSFLTGRPNDLYLLATGDAKDRAEFVRLMSQDEEFVAWASTFISQGQQTAAEVIDRGKKGYQLVFGFRRLLAVLYNWAGTGKGTPTLEVVVAPRVNDVGRIHRSLVENTALAPNPIERAQAIQTALNLGEDEETLAARYGRSTTWVHEQLRLLALPSPTQKRVADGKVAPTTALSEARQEADANGTEPKVSRQGIKTRAKEALEPFVKEVKERYGLELITDPEADQNQELVIRLKVHEVNAIVALLEKAPRKKGGQADEEPAQSEE